MTEAPHHVRLSQIEIGNERARDLDPDHARALADSIMMQGLLYPVLVRSLGEDRFHLVDGRHRYEAFKILDRSVIPVVMSDKVSDDEAMLDQVMANLARRMVALDFCRHLFMLKQAWLRLYPGSGRGGDRRPADIKLQNLEFDLEGGKPIGFVGAMADKFNLGKAAIFEAVAIWKNLTPDSRQRLHGSELAGKKTELKALSGETPARQAKIIDLILSPDQPEVKSVSDALAFLEGGVQPTSVEKRLQALRDTLKTLPEPVFDRLVAENADRMIAALTRMGRI